MDSLLAGAAAMTVVLALLAWLPRLWLRRSQDRLARRLLDAEPGRFQLLTRAEQTAGKFRRLPGVLGLTREALVFEGLFGEIVLVPTARVEKIVTGRRLSSGRQLMRLEVLRLTRSGAEELEFVLNPDSASAWRSHLGLWAVQERKAAVDTVSPGR